MALIDLISKGAKSLYDKYTKAQNSAKPSNSGGSGGSGNSGGGNNVDYYLKELGRAQRAWYEYNDPKLKDQAHQYANKLRQEAAAKGIDLNQYGVKTQHGYDFRHHYTEPGLVGKNHDKDSKPPEWLNVGGAVGMPAGTSSGGGGGGTGSISPSMDMYTRFQELMMGMNPNSDYFETLQAQAQAQAEAIAKQQRSALQQMIDNLKKQQEAGMMGIQNNLKDAQQGVEDKSFQAWLAARQAMANRGLAGSGIASDQDTRLLLQKQRDLAGIYRDAARQEFELENRVGSQLDEAYRKLSEINPSQIGAELFQKLYAEGRQGLMDQAKLYQQMLSELLPYDKATMKDMLDYQLGSQKNQLDMLDLALKRLEGDRRYSIDLSRSTGYLYGADGRPIMVNGRMVPLLDREKLEEAIRHNKATEDLKGKELIAQMQKWANDAKIASRRLELDEAEFNHKMQFDQTEIDMAKDKLKTEKDKLLVSSLQAQLSGIDSQINSALRRDGVVPPQLAQQRDAIISQIAKVFDDGAVIEYEDVEDAVTRHMANNGKK